MRFTTPKILAASLLGAALVLGGCGLGEEAAEKGLEEAMEAGASDGTDVDIDGEDGNVKVESSDGSMEFGGDTELPESFPDDIPLPDEDYDVRMATEQSDGTTMVSLFTTGDVDVIADHIEDGVRSSGYQVDATRSTDIGATGQRHLEASGNGLDLTVVVTGAEDGTVGVQYHIGTSEPGE
jgi:hypothetical protein